MKASIARALSIAATSACILSSPAEAVIVYGGGQTHVVTTAVNDYVIVEDGATLRVGAGGELRAQGVPVDVPNAIAVGALQSSNDHTNTVEVFDNGRVIAAPGELAIAYGLLGTNVSVRDDGYILGDIEADTAGSRISGIPPRQRLLLQDRAVVDGNVHVPGQVSLRDDVGVNGDVRGFNGDVSFDMHGGAVAGALRLGGLNNHGVILSGGSVLGGMSNFDSFVDLHMTGGYLGGAGIDTTGQLDATISGGRIEGGLRVATSSFLRAASQISFFGGSLDTVADDWLIELTPGSSSSNLSMLEIWGGQFGYSEGGLGIRLDDFTNFDIYGRDLLFANGLLTGYLRDGSWFTSALTFGDNWSGEFRIHNVPEPGTLGLFSLALLGLGAARRARRSSPT